MRKRLKIRYKKERALLSDVLPYETPITFTNRHFYDFIENFKITFSDDKIFWKSNDNAALDTIIHILFALPENQERISSQKNGIKCYNFKSNGQPKPEYPLIPFGYKIRHKQKEFRELNVPHPRSQILVVSFYEQYKESIIYYCSQSYFSIRAPRKIATYKFYKDNLHKSKSSDDTSSIEEINKEYKNQKSFFSYKDYSNIYKFYESPRYHRCEKKYNKLLKLDISKCFDSIYTHSLAWALLGKQAVKENLKAVKNTFAGQFDRLMQNINYGETNGIIIGPELSRIFAEIILQAADKKIEFLLETEHGLQNKVDFEMLRYVDDYFIFYNEEKDKNTIVEIAQHVLEEYKLHLNSAKEVEYEKPIITEMSIAKERISKLLESELKYKLETVEEENDEGLVKHEKGSIDVKSKKLIIDFKTIIKDCQVEYKDTLNYSFAIIEKKCRQIINNFTKADPDHRSEEGFAKAIVSLLEFVFFIYSVSPRVNTTIKLCTVLKAFLSYLNGSKFCPDENKHVPNIKNSENKHRVFKCIYDNITLVMKKTKSSGTTQVETLYLLIAMAELGKEYWLEEEVLAEHFGIEGLKSGNPRKNSCLNYFSLTVFLYYMREKAKYRNLRNLVEEMVIEKFQGDQKILRKSSEHTMLFFDMLSCPFIKIETKKEILQAYDIKDTNLQNDLINFQIANTPKQLCFTTWGGFNFAKELDAKRSQEVY